MQTVRPRIEIYDAQGDRVATYVHARQITVRASFGAMPARCDIALHTGQPPTDLECGYRVDVSLDETLVFRGRVETQRSDTSQPPASWVAARDPERTLRFPVTATYGGLAPSTILSDIVSRVPNDALSLGETSASSWTLDQLRFHQTPLVYAIDLLAKLDGNRLWDIDWSNTLRWRPADTTPDHVIYIDACRHRLSLGETIEQMANAWELHGGADAFGTEYRRFFESTESEGAYGLRPDTLFARAISTDDAFARLRDALLAHVPLPSNERHLDFAGGNASIQPGDILDLRSVDQRTFDADGVYRAKTVEHRWALGKLATRVHFAAGYESSSRYVRYIDHDPVRVNGMIGRFQLDVSGLDTAAHLDT